MAVMGAVVVHKHLGIYIYGCGIKRASGFCAVDITAVSRILLQGQLSHILEQCRGNPRHGFSLLILEMCFVCLEVRLFSV